MSDLAIRLRGISKRYGKKTAVRDLDLDVPRGSIYGLLGPNGAGKTTTLRIILDIIGADEGEVTVLGTSDVESVRGRIGYLPEERGLYPKMKVLEHLVFFGEIKGMTRADARREAEAGLERLTLADRADDRVETLSKGMQQKVQFLSTILHRPELLILDEPFGGLDPINVDLFKRMVLERQRAGATVLFSTHLIEDAERLCERVCMIAGATKVLDGPVADVKAATGRREVAISYEGDGRFLDAPELVERMSEHGRYVEVRLAADADPQKLLRRAVEAGVRISRFELVEPSLREIFLEKAKEAGLSASAVRDQTAPGPPRPEAREAAAT
ncbi:MAG: ABC transporter ATP-binding protein [Gemmatimonadota bacterium]